MNETLKSILAGTSALSISASIALAFTLQRKHPESDDLSRERVQSFLLAGVAFQCFHLMEEFLTGFYEKFPSFLNLTAWSPGFFVGFNLTWIAIWLFASVALGQAQKWAIFATWFFAIVMTLNGLSHPLLGIAVGGYFPGLLTSPIVGWFGIRLWRKLIIVTR